MMSLQENITDFVEDVFNVKILNGNLITGTVTSTGTAISHGLERQPKGWMLADVMVDTTVHRTAWDSKHITLQSSAPSAAITIWVF